MSNGIKVAKKALEEVDMFKANATLRVYEQDSYRSCRLGFLSIFLIMFFIYIFVLECIKLFTHSKIQVSYFNSRISSNETKGYIPMFAVTLDFLPVDQFLQLFQFILEIYVKGVLSSKISMKPCLPSQWKQLGDNYQQLFDQYSLKVMFCPQKEGGFNISQTFRSNQLDFLKITMKGCDPINNSQCNPDLIQSYLASRTKNGGSAQIWVYTLDQVLNPQKKDPVSYFINIDAKTQLTSKFGGAIGIQYGSYQIESDVSILPYQKIEKIEGSLVDQVRSYHIEFNNLKTDRLVVISISMNQKNQIIKRTFGKLDEALSYVGGLFSIIITILSFFLANFNKYRYEIFVGNRGNSECVKMGLFMYIKYTIFDWMNLLFISGQDGKQKREKWGESWEDCKKIDSVREKGIEMLSVENIDQNMSTIQEFKLILMFEKNKKTYLEKLKTIGKSQNIKNQQLLRYLEEILEDKPFQKYTIPDRHQSTQNRLQEINLEIEPDPTQQVGVLSKQSLEVQKKICRGLQKKSEQQKNKIFQSMPLLMVKRLKKLVPQKLIRS